MKLLTTIAAVLISISAFSQNFIEYDKGTFTHNGEELSMQQINDLTLLHQAGRGDFRRGINFDVMHKANIYLRGTNNTLYFLGGVATGYVGGIGVWIGTIFIYDVPIGAAAFLGAGTGLCVGSYKAFEQVSLKEGCLRRRDNQFNKVADKINQAIAAGGPLVQSSNQ